jgi:hypothetical protein
LHLEADAGLIPPVDQQRAGRQRDAGPGRKADRTRDHRRGDDRREDVPGIGDELIQGLRRRDPGDRLGDPVGQFHLALQGLSVGPLHGSQRAASKPAEMPGEHLVGVAGIEGAAIDQDGVNPAELLAHPGRDELLVDARGKRGR